MSLARGKLDSTKRRSKSMRGRGTGLAARRSLFRFAHRSKAPSKDCDAQSRQESMPGCCMIKRRNIVGLHAAVRAFFARLHLCPPLCSERRTACRIDLVTPRRRLTAENNPRKAEALARSWGHAAPPSATRGSVFAQSCWQRGSSAAGQARVLSITDSSGSGLSRESSRRHQSTQQPERPGQ